MIPLIAASEKGKGQTESVVEMRLEMWWSLQFVRIAGTEISQEMLCVEPKSSRKSLLERSTSEGDSPVFEDNMACSNRVGLPR